MCALFGYLKLACAIGDPRPRWTGANGREPDEPAEQQIVVELLTAAPSAPCRTLAAAAPATAAPAGSTAGPGVKLVEISRQSR